MKSTLQKLFAALLAVCLLLAALPIGASAATIADFKDVKPGVWYYSAVDYCVRKGVMNGVSSTSFDPNGKVTRAQVVQVLYNIGANNSPATDAVRNMPFTDSGPNKWYTTAIAWAWREKIVNGTSQTTFSPNNPVTREQAATMFYNFYKWSQNITPAAPNAGLMTKYTDWGRVSSYAKTAINWSVQYGLMSGTSATTLDPQGTCVRAQLAQFIKNYDTEVLAYDPGAQPQPTIEPTPTPTPDPVPTVDPNSPITAAVIAKEKSLHGVDISDCDGVPTAIETEALRLINAERTKAGLPEVQWSREAQYAAEVRAKEIGLNYIKTAGVGINDTTDKTGATRLVHSRPDKTLQVVELNKTTGLTGKALRQEFDRQWAAAHGGYHAGMDWHTIWADLYGEAEWDRVNIGENAARGQTTAKKVVNDWMNSQGHKSVILSEASCVAVAYDPATNAWAYLNVGYTY